MLTLLGVPFAAPLAVVTFLFDLIPLVGATVGAVIVGLVTVFNDFPTTTIIWTVWAIVYQQVENNLIQPRIQSKAVNVEGFFVLVSVLFGATLFGIAGALLAIPVAATVQIFLAEWLVYRRELRGEPLRRPRPRPRSDRSALDSTLTRPGRAFLCPEPSADLSPPHPELPHGPRRRAHRSHPRLRGLQAAHYQTNKSKRNDPDRITLRKFCKWCRRHTSHRETR